LVAVFGGAERLYIENGGLLGDLDADGTRERLRMCTSTEGLHITVWSGEAPTDPRRWHFYYYLGYDVMPNCTEADHAETP
jgi:hypothetical protein